MEKTINTTEITKKNDAVTTDCHEQNTHNKIYKRETRRDYKKSPRTEQSNKISTWLSKDITRASSGTSNKHSEEIKKREENSRESTEHKSEENLKSSLHSKHVKNKVELKSRNKNREGSKENLTYVKSSKTGHRSKNTSKSPKNKEPKKTKGSHARQEQLNSTPIKQRNKDEAVFRRSPRINLQDSKPLLSPVAKKLFTKCKVLPNNKINVSFTEHEKKKVDKLETDGNQSRSKESNNDRLCKRKESKSKAWENLESQIKRRRLDLDSSVKKTEHSRGEKNENNKDVKQLNADSSRKKYKKDDKVDKDKYKEKINDNISSKKKSKYKTESEDKSHGFHEIQEKLDNFLKVRSEQDKTRQQLNTTPIKQRNNDEAALRRSPRINLQDSKPLLSPIAKELFTKCEVSPNNKINVWLNEHENKKVDKLETDGNHSKSKESNNDRLCKRKESKRGSLESHIKQRKLDLDSSVKKTEHSRGEKNENNKDVKQLNADSSRKKHKKDGKVDKTKHEEKINNNISSKKKRYKTQSEDKSHGFHEKQGKLDNFLKDGSKQDKVSKKTKLSRSQPSEGCDFPSFRNLNKKSKASKSSESFEKYGVTLPSIEEILKEKEDLAKYKNQMESFQDIELDSFALPFSVNDLNRTEINSIPILGCKHLTTEEITDAFKKNLTYISDIFNGKRYNERHNRFFNNKIKNYSLTIKDLTCSTSVVVFNYEQKEHMVNLLKDEFDPDDTWTPYFFQVLLPELCLKIFMDVHEMTYEGAVKYLDVRPITDD